VTDSDAEILADLLLRWEELREMGQDTPAEEICQDHPHLVAEFTRRTKILAVTSWLDHPNTGTDSLTVAPDVPTEPRTLANRYRLDNLVAEGGFAQVWRAYDIELQRVVAVKVPKPSRLQSSDAFMAEARRVARLKHPGIVQVYDVGTDGELCFIVSEFIEGGSLADRLSKNSPSTEQAIRWIIDIADALEHAHLHGVIHRDIKPANILIDHHGRALLADFGIAQSANKAGQEALSLGTLRYMSPEQLEGRACDLRADIFSLGVVLHEATTGHLPYSSVEPNVLRREIVAGIQKVPAVPDHIKGICQKALQRNPSDRQVSAACFAAELRRSLSRPKSSLMRWAGLVVGLVVLVGVVWMTLPKRGQLQRQIVEQTGTIKLDSEPGTFTFDGTNRIVTPLVSFAPCTIEAWFRTNGDKSEQFIIGSDVPNFYGIGLGIKDNAPIVETIRGGFDIATPITPGQWTHIAAVYGPNETVLFLNGKKIGVGPATAAPSRPTHFVVGNVGEDHGNLFFHGQIRCLRISRGVRYSADFEPESSFVPDAADVPDRAVLIYDGLKVEGERVTDLSGEGNDGRR
jgi:eukaryotic-like serine/threonine-protein kinase